jgi:cytochrome b561
MALNENSRYSRVAQWLHWVIAIMVIGNIVGGIFHDAIGKQFPVMPIHKAVGITVLALTLVRIGWRLTHAAPPLPARMPGWEKGLARFSHLFFYILLLLVPLSGWIMTSAGTRPLTWFGLFDIPKWSVTKDDMIVELSRTHGAMGLAFAALAILHIAAALRHHYILRDNVMRRMLG